MPAIEWKKVCCPVDFSDPSRAALRVAVDLAMRFGAELTVFHVDRGEARMTQDFAGNPDDELARWRMEAQQLGATRVVTAKAGGEPEQGILDFARKGRFDLVVMGTHGRTGRDRSLVGSVTENVVRRSDIPVLTVHHAWGRGR